jgi:ribosome-associated heat shock protein Hsp15
LTDGAQRLDLWLWHARFRSARADCARLVEGGAVRLNRRPVDKPGTRVRPGDVLTVALGAGLRLDGAPAGRVRVVRVVALAERRGPAAEACLLYDEIAEP